MRNGLGRPPQPPAKRSRKRNISSALGSAQMTSAKTVLKKGYYWSTDEFGIKVARKSAPVQGGVKPDDAPTPSPEPSSSDEQPADGDETDLFDPTN